MEVVTQRLGGAALVPQLRLVADLCVALDPSGLDVSYGWACDLEIDELYTDHGIESHGLLDFVDDSTRRPNAPLRIENESLTVLQLLDEVSRQARGVVWAITYDEPQPLQSLRVGVVCPSGTFLKISVQQ